MNIKNHFFLVLVLFVVGCASVQPEKTIAAIKKHSRSDEQNFQILVGKWYGNQPTTDGGKREQLVIRNHDGTHIIHFRVHEPNGETWDQIEVGEWGISGDIYFTIFKGWIKNGTFKPSTGNVAYNRDAYKILELTGAQFVYESAQDGEVFSLEKVDAVFELQ